MRSERPGPRVVFSRFEQKLLAVFLVVAFVPLGVALSLGGHALSEAYGVGMNGRVRSALERGVDARREAIDDARRGAEAIAAHALAIAESGGSDDEVARLGEVHREVAHIDVVDTSGKSRAWHREVAPGGRCHVFAAGDERRAHVRVEVCAPETIFRAHREAGALFAVYRRLEDETPFVVASYLAAYASVLLAVIGTIALVGVLLARRVTRRVPALAEAARRVGRGDLDVEVPAATDDELGDLVRAFNEMVRELRGSRERIDYLTRVAGWQDIARRLAHEVKNPLTPIQLAVQETARGYRGDDEAFRRKLDDARSIVEEEVETLRRLVNEFSEFARLPQASLAPIDLAPWLDELVRTIDPSSLGGDPGGVPTLERMIDGPLPVRLDVALFRRAIDNLVRNAVQAASGRDADDRPRRVVVRAERAGESVVIAIRDSGPGVPLDDRERIFDAYFTTKREGMGLGLAIVKKTVLEHDGTIAFHEAPEGGAEVRVTLPLDRGADGVDPLA